MLAVFCFVLSLILSEVGGVSDVLRQTQPLYGLSTVIEEYKNNTCFKQLKLLRVAVDEGKVWALKAMDASGRPRSGFIYGNNLWIGSHSQCKDISNTKPLEINNEKVKHLRTPHDYPPYPMEFAVVHIRHNSTIQLHTQQHLEWIIQLGLCIPKACSEYEILNLFKTYIENRYLEVQNLYDLHMEVVEARKVRDDSLWFFKLPKTIAFSVLFVIILLLTITGTVYDARRNKLHRNNLICHNPSCIGKTGSLATIDLVTKSSSEELLQQSTLGEVLQCFSFTTNTKNLMKTKLPPDSVGCIHGMRFISMLWVVAVHSVFYQADYLTNVPMGYRISEGFLEQTFSNSTYCVDSYLFISGFLVGYLYYKSKNPHLKSDEPGNYLLKIREFVMAWIHRFFRLTPPYLVILLFTNIIYTFYRESSPLTSSERPDLLCDKYWWRNLLYINNLFPRSEMCMSWSWYLSVDTQLFTVTMVLLIISTISFKTSAVAVLVLILSSMVATGWKSYSIGYIPTMDEQLVQLDAIYDLPWNRLGPYLVGVITAYILKIKLQNKLTLTKRVRVLLWIIFPLLNTWILFTLYTRQLSVEFSAVYMGISRTLWGIGIAWVLIACCTGNAQSIQKLLSFRGFVPLSRLTYCVYLLNPVVANMVYLGGESSFDSSLAEFVIIIGGITLITFYMAYLFSVIVESPFILLTKMVLGKIGTKSPRSESDSKVAG